MSVDKSLAKKPHPESIDMTVITTGKHWKEMTFGIYHITIPGEKIKQHDAPLSVDDHDVRLAVVAQIYGNRKPKELEHVARYMQFQYLLFVGHITEYPLTVRGLERDEDDDDDSDDDDDEDEE